jgi:hypothetical protein
LYQQFKNKDYGKGRNGFNARNVSRHLHFRVCGSSVVYNKKYSKMVETLIRVAAGFAVVFFIVGIVAVLWQVAKYMATRGMEEGEKYES